MPRLPSPTGGETEDEGRMRTLGARDGSSSWSGSSRGVAGKGSVVPSAGPAAVRVGGGRPRGPRPSRAAAGAAAGRRLVVVGGGVVGGGAGRRSSFPGPRVAARVGSRGSRRRRGGPRAGNWKNNKPTSSFPLKILSRILSTWRSPRRGPPRCGGGRSRRRRVVVVRRRRVRRPRCWALSSLPSVPPVAPVSRVRPVSARVRRVRRVAPVRASPALTSSPASGVSSGAVLRGGGVDLDGDALDDVVHPDQALGHPEKERPDALRWGEPHFSMSERLTLTLRRRRTRSP